jgi:hypothetical protein
MNYGYNVITTITTRFSAIPRLVLPTNLIILRTA